MNQQCITIGNKLWHHKRKICLANLLFFLTSYSFSQSTSLKISADYINTPFEDVVLDLENRYPISFFYDDAWINGVEISLKVEQSDLDMFLKTLLEKTNIQYYITEDHRIILVKGHELVTKIPKDYFDRIRQNNSVANRLEIFEDNTGEESEIISDTGNIQFEIGDKNGDNDGRTATISGYIRNSKSGEPLIGVSVFKNDPFVGVVTDAFGYYVLTIPKGRHRLFFKSVGMLETNKLITLYGDGRFDIEMEEDIVSLKEVVIQGEKDIVDNLHTGRVKIDYEALKSMPPMLGDADIMKITLTLPGIQSVGEGSSGFNVRGGAADQNLILINDAVIYNPNHLFGFFSAFNPDVIKRADLFKSGIQAHFGGRISSVFDVAVRDGNKKKFSVSGGISPVTGKITLEGPIKKDTTSFLLGLRSTYSDWILGQLKDPALSNSAGFFADAITKVVHQIDDRNSLTFSAYHSRDRFRLDSDTLYRYFNTNASVRWRHTINSRLFSSVLASYSNYTYDLNSRNSSSNAFELDYSINNTTVKSSIDWIPDARHNIKIGIDGTFYNLSPGSIKPLNEQSVIKQEILDKEKGLEGAIHLGDEFEYSDKLSLYAGIRFSHFSLIGPGNVFTYQSGISREVDFITDTIAFDNGSVIKSYSGPEYRFSLRYKLANDLSLKFSYDRTRQYIHQLTNSIAISPTDTWRLSNTHLKPQIGDQYSAGLYKNFLNKGIEISLEGYYKTTKNVLEYKDGADLLINEVLETDVIGATGRSYGVEVLVRKKVGKLNGWISYTYSRSEVKANGLFEGEKINNGKYFPSNFDKPHNLSFISNYKFNRRVSLSLNFTYSSGRPVTFPISTYKFRNNVFASFSDRNQLRIPDYYRLDVGINLEGNHKVNKPAHGSWSFSVYNLTGRNNVYSIFSSSEGRSISVNQLSIFSVPIPTITYNFKF
ncbi:carboxypeptidase-like regulatory domain-containing protein [Fulvivirgaceae bacterium BMA10]|uniref:Carboxypeptidase-like regulatory domain-containing protein n=1 Tax=Splendidivirga corallicola TaxID=3051826 RepID=A0ABT8KHU8_9BACT|nr:carboxypeptidase-like regulatory domain-containing protein [Fulvivirgaceae bacterium BMA10]